MGKYDDKGFLGPNKYRKSDKAPHLTGVLNFSKKTVQRLQDLLDDDEEVKLQISAWRSDDDPKRFSLKIEEPYEGKKSGGGDRRRRDDDDEDERPWRSASKSRKNYDDDEDERPSRSRSRRRDDDDEDKAPW